MIAGSLYILLRERCVGILVTLCLLTASHLNAQLTDTTGYDLHTIVIVPLYETSLQPSKKTVLIDSAALARSASRSLSELLAEHSTIYIKSYGSGNIASSSFRGGNASHTAVLWNGLNIQQAMLGQTDLSLIPSLFFDQVSLEYGSGSALWGSGAIGGSIRLDNQLRFKRGMDAKAQLSLGSFDTKKGAASVLLSNTRIASNTRLYHTSSENNYRYRDSSDHEQATKQLNHANYVMAGIMQELSFRLSGAQTLNLRAWYNRAERNLPSYTSTISKQNQQDDNLKLNADWNRSCRRLNSTLRLAGFRDQLNYRDSLAGIYSRSTVHSLIAESDHVYRYRHHAVSLGVNYTGYQSALPVRSSMREDSAIRHTQQKIAVFALYRISLLKSRLSYDLAVRKEFSTPTSIPFTGHTGIRFEVLRWLSVQLSANKAYRQPTLNDLYWPQGGNPLLKPEESVGMEGSLLVSHRRKNWALTIDATYFNRHTTNWIIWLPTASAYFSPRNVAEVYSRGTETRSVISYRKNSLQLSLSISTSYVLSTNESPTNENDNAVGRQLIYTPRYMGQSAFNCVYKAFTVSISQNYTGYRFTSTDNTSWLNPYYLVNARISYRKDFTIMSLELFAAVYNMLDANYMAVANRPMPMRSYEGGLIWHYHRNPISTKS